MRTFGHQHSRSLLRVISGDVCLCPNAIDSMMRFQTGPGRWHVLVRPDRTFGSAVVDEDSGGGGLDVEVVIGANGEVPHPAGADTRSIAAEAGGGDAAGSAQT